MADSFQLDPTGLLTPGNINLSNRPKVRNPDGSISTVRSMSFEQDGKEILIPTVSDDGKILSDKDAIAAYQRTGKHLGIFDNPQNATAYAQQLHESQAKSLGMDSFQPDAGTPLGTNVPGAAGMKFSALGFDPSKPELPPSSAGELFSTAGKDIIGAPLGAVNALIHPIDTLRGLAGRDSQGNPVPDQPMSLTEMAGHALGIGALAGAGRVIPKLSPSGLVERLRALPPEVQAKAPSAVKWLYFADALRKYAAGETPAEPSQPFRPNPAIRSKTSFGGPTDPGYTEPNPMPAARPGRLALPEEPTPEPREPFRPNPRIAAKTRFGGSTSPGYSTPKSTPKIRARGTAKVPEVPGSEAPTAARPSPRVTSTDMAAAMKQAGISSEDVTVEDLMKRTGADKVTADQAIAELKRMEHKGKAEGVKKRSARGAKSAE